MQAIKDFYLLNPEILFYYNQCSLTCKNKEKR